MLWFRRPRPRKFLLWGQRQIEKESWFLWLFAPVSWVWGCVVWIKNFFYDHQWLPIARPLCPVVSVGNLVAGGTGKTPLVYLLASQLLARCPNVSIAILSRGYGPIPDEALFLQKRLSQARVYIGKDRVSLARQATQEGAKLLILDDGLQYRKLHRDFDLVMLASSDPLGKGRFLPCGFLRDSPKRLAAAQRILILEEETYRAQSARCIEVLNGKSPCIGLQRIVEGLRDLADRPLPIETIQDLPVALFCAIAKPKTFQKTVLDRGAVLIATWELADHEVPGEQELLQFSRLAKQKGAQALLCTEKDGVKLKPETPSALPIYQVETSLRVTEGHLEWHSLVEDIAKMIEDLDNVNLDER